MMIIPGLKQQIETVIGTTLDEYEVTIEEWEESAAKLFNHNYDNSTYNGEPGGQLSEPERDTYTEARSLSTGERIYFKVGVNAKEGNIICWGCSTEAITRETKGLIELLILNYTEASPEEAPVVYESDREQQLAELGQWLVQQMNDPSQYESVPEHLSITAELSTEKIPFLLQCETPDAHRIRSKELNKLLESYFGELIILIPMGEQEWVFLADEEIVMGEVEEDTVEARKDLLNAFCLGLYELVASEWAGVFHLSALLPCHPVTQLAPATALLQESVQLGRAFHVAQHIHLPWNLQLEQVVASIPEQQRLRFIKDTGKDTTIFNDSETLTTLETFFSLDCNVSETAKRLFIHRNTLVYRLDKIKQEIGYDVRSFESAVLVRLLLLMYKVTKKL
ncbi:sugar diacid utilization regulator [Paenibacillus amylolyticus]|uniref:Sugar diacid utilization regulator n=1 Tax=Paenibacillus amylolyticus TaxID=1451 RepID=A0AAP5H5T4_PAEAM|nr:helix-turn-helix domain-containing protein [Paenibacillus amylolyticus]MDR6726387.1 sugar diacid utilization regulator [Paenibacillus amylolyticus]